MSNKNLRSMFFKIKDVKIFVYYEAHLTFDKIQQTSQLRNFPCVDLKNFTKRSGKILFFDVTPKLTY